MADTKAFNRMIKAAQHLCAEHEAQSVSDGDVFDLFRAIIAADYATADVKTLNRQLANTEAALAECEQEKAELKRRLSVALNPTWPTIYPRVSPLTEADERPIASCCGCSCGRCGHQGGKDDHDQACIDRLLTEAGEQEKR